MPDHTDHAAKSGRLSFAERQAVRFWALLLFIAPSLMFDKTIDLGIEIAGRAVRSELDRLKGGTSLAA